MQAVLALLAVAVAVVPGAAQDDDNSTNSSNGVANSLGYSPPLCGQSKRDLEKDFVRRFCLRQCRLEENKRIRPTFDEWEKYCRDTAGMEEWDEDCKRYMGCTYGCDVWGGDRDQLLLLTTAERPQFLLTTHANMYAAGITKEQRCVLEKCHAFCARTSFETCRETQFTQRCRDSNPHLYGCDVDCSGSVRGARPGGGVAAATAVAVLASLAATVAMPPLRWEGR